MESLQFGQESKMAVTGPKAKKEVVVEEVIVPEVFETRIKIVQRDIALVWPSTDKNAENVDVFEDYMTILLNAGWKVENSQIGVRRPIGDMANEFVVPMLFILTR